MLRYIVQVCVLISILTSCCQPNSCLLEPTIVYVPQQRLVNALPSCFEPLTAEECQTDWGKELTIGIHFATDFDFYRAITAFKRALILLPTNCAHRRQQIEYEVILSYYLANKYTDTLEAFEESSLITATTVFPAFGDLLVILYDCYNHTGQGDKATRVFELIQKGSSTTAQELTLYSVISSARLDVLPSYLETCPYPPATEFLDNYCCCAKSVRTAQTLNALLPGAGYFYIGQQKTALTSLLLNTLFIAASYQLFDRGYVAAGIFVTSLEMGWYFGGINGAGLAAKSYNEQLYSDLGKEMLIQNQLFPVLMLQYSF